MNTEAQMQAAFKKLVSAPEDLSELVKAFEVFLQAFITLKRDNEKSATEMQEEMRDSLKMLKATVAKILKGKDGYTPRAGVDYPTRTELAAMLEAMRPKAPQEGVDFFVPRVEDIMRKVMEQIPPTDIFKALFTAPDNVISAINQAENQIKPERVEGLEKLIDQVRKKSWAPFYAAAPQTSTSIKAWSTPSETPNGVTTVFSVGSQAPTDVVADGIYYYSGQGYTFASSQLTFTIPPSQYVRYR